MNRFRDYQYEEIQRSLDSLPADAYIHGVPDKEFVNSILAVGVIYPIIMTVYQGQEYLIDGGRRIKGSRMAKQIGLDKEQDVSHLDPITVKMFQEVSPHDRDAWSLILNWQRSDNPINAWKRIHSLQHEGNWKAIQKEIDANPAYVKRIMTLDKLADPMLWVGAFESGKVSETTLFGIAKLPVERQKYIEDVLAAKKKVSAKDLNASRTVAATQAMSAIAFNMPVVGQAGQLPTNGSRQFFVVVRDDDLSHSDIITDFHQAIQIRNEMGGNLYKLIKVNG